MGKSTEIKTCTDEVKAELRVMCVNAGLYPKLTSQIVKELV